MSTMPPQKDEPEDMDADYRRWSTSDTARPADSVRPAVLAHAARLAAERRNSSAPSKRRRYRWAAPVFGGLAAATLVGFIVIPRFIESRPAAGKAGEAGARIASDVPLATAREAAPAVPSAPVPAPTIAANSPPIPAERLDSKAAKSASSSAQSRDKRASPASAAQNILGGVSADSAASAPSAVFSPRAGFTATAGNTIDAGEALRRSANLGDLPGVTGLLGGKIDIESRDSAGRTALMLAAASGRTAVVSALLARGADPNATDSYGESPLHAALAGNYVEIANALRRAGAH